MRKPVDSGQVASLLQVKQWETDSRHFTWNWKKLETEWICSLKCHFHIFAYFLRIKYLDWHPLRLELCSVVTIFRSESIPMRTEQRKIGLGFKMAWSRVKYCFLSSTPPPFLPPLQVSRPALPRTSVGMYPPLNRSRWATAGSLTAQYGSSINQRHFQCPITETLLLGLSEADSSPIHLLWEKKKKAIVARQSPLPVQTKGC